MIISPILVYLSAFLTVFQITWTILQKKISQISQIFFFTVIQHQLWVHQLYDFPQNIDGENNNNNFCFLWQFIYCSFLSLFFLSVPLSDPQLQQECIFLWGEEWTRGFTCQKTQTRGSTRLEIYTWKKIALKIYTQTYTNTLNEGLRSSAAQHPHTDLVMTGWL